VTGVIRESGIEGSSASRAAARMLDKGYRSYRAAPYAPTRLMMVAHSDAQLLPQR
jgi:hypothetical protein